MRQDSGDGFRTVNAVRDENTARAELVAKSVKSVDGSVAISKLRASFGFQSSSMVEHAAVNRVVEGSSPSSGANFPHALTLNDWSSRNSPACSVKVSAS